MGKGLIRHIVIVLIILCLPFLGFAKGQNEAEKATSAQSGEPQRGGTFNMYIGFEPSSWDQWDGINNMEELLPYFYSNLMLGDVEKYGPRGTNQFPFTLTEYIPDKFLSGQLAESWEITSNPLGVKFHLRKGVMWTGNAKIGMKPRELTATDAAYSFNRFQKSPQGPKRIPFMTKPGFEALDKYTLQAKFTTFSGGWPVAFGYGHDAWLVPQEVVDAGASDWRNQTSSGPFILKDYVKGSYVSFTRNPDWWNKKKVINGKSYELPFVDEVMLPIIVDRSTQIAALRTGKVDMAREIGLMYQETLSKSSPKLIIKDYAGGSADYVTWSYQKPPTNNLQVRRALMIGTDLNALVKAIHIKSDINVVPFNPGIPVEIYTPIQDLPPDAKELFTYDPVKAKKMLADAGYPDGFTLGMEFSATDGGGRYNQEAALLADMWAKLGVKLELKPLDSALFDQRYNKGQYEGAVLKGGGNAKPAGMDLYKERAYPWMLLSHDKWFTETLDKASAEPDETKRNAMLKELAVYYVKSVVRLPVGNPNFLNCWWPWVNNYYGEIEAGVGPNMVPMISSLWIDQKLKKSMGY